MTDFFAQANELYEFSRSLRRDFHRHPELGFQEVRTAGIVARELSALGFEVSTGVGKTGVVGMLEGGASGQAQPPRTLLLRFDMDALPITEETGAEYASQTPGLMHACGHDAHVAIGLTVARLLAANRAQLGGNVKFVFQPAEEGMGGAQSMIDDGVLENPRPDFALGLHVWNDRPVNWMAITDGPIMAGAEIFKVQISGKGGHGALPNLAIDPVLAAAQVITALQGIVSRNVSPLEAAVVSVTTVHGGEAFNVIPQAVNLSGTIRTFDPATRQRVLDRFQQVIQGVAEAMQCRAAIEIIPLTAAVVNNPAVSARVRQTLVQALPRVELHTNFITMGSEDMSCFMQQIPGCFIFAGSADAERGLNFSHHHPRFDIDEAVLPRAAALMSAAAVDLLGSPSPLAGSAG